MVAIDVLEPQRDQGQCQRERPGADADQHREHPDERRVERTSARRTRPDNRLESAITRMAGRLIRPSSGGTRASPAEYPTAMAMPTWTAAAVSVIPASVRISRQPAEDHIGHHRLAAEIDRKGPGDPGSGQRRQRQPAAGRRRRPLCGPAADQDQPRNQGDHRDGRPTSPARCANRRRWPARWAGWRPQRRHRRWSAGWCTPPSSAGCGRGNAAEPDLGSSTLPTAMPASPTSEPMNSAAVPGITDLISCPAISASRAITTVRCEPSRAARTGAAKPITANARVGSDSSDPGGGGRQPGGVPQFRDDRARAR